MNNIDAKLNSLKEYIKNLNSAAVAYSAGVDSTFLLKIAHDVLKENILACTIKSSLTTKDEINNAIEFCKNQKIKHEIIEVNVFNIENFTDNPPDRCYICKKELFKKIINCAIKYNINNIIEGSNIDDISDYRPGTRAIKELNIKSPLQIAKLTKKEIRELSKRYNLKTYNKQSMACLASRIPYNEKITKEKLEKIEKSEKILSDMGFKNYRVRIHGDNLARIEINPEDFKRLIDNKNELLIKLKTYDFKYISMDLEGFRSGSMNEIL